MGNRKVFFASIGAIVCYVIFGLSFIFSAAALKSASPSVLLAYRFDIAFLLMNLIWAASPVKMKFAHKDMRLVILMGVFQPVIYYFCENNGIQMTNAVFSAVMIALIPIVALVIAAAVLKEKPKMGQILFSLLSVLGVIIISLLKGGIGENVTASGVAVLGIAVVCAAVYNILSRKLSKEFTAFERTYIMFFLGAIVFTLSAVFENLSSAENLIKPLESAQFVYSVIFLGAFSSVGAFLLLNNANTHLPTVRTQSYSNITTVVSLFAGMVISDGETVYGISSVLCAVMIIVGVWGVQHFANQR